MITLRSRPIVVDGEPVEKFALSLESNGRVLSIREIGSEAKMLCGDEGTVIEVRGAKMIVLKQGGSYICQEMSADGDTIFLGRVFKHIIIGDRFFSGVY